MGSGNSKEQQQEEFEKKQEAPRLSLVDPRIRDEYESKSLPINTRDLQAADHVDPGM